MKYHQDLSVTITSDLEQILRDLRHQYNRATIVRALAQFIWECSGDEAAVEVFNALRVEDGQMQFVLVSAPHPKNQPPQQAEVKDD